MRYMVQIENRKADHINICMTNKVTSKYCYWDDIRLFHNAMPEVNIDSINTECKIFGRILSFPLIVTGMTGGFPDAKRINKNIAEACAFMGIGMGVGSERAGVDGINTDSYSIVKEYDIPLVIGNIGAPQLIDQKDKNKFSLEMVGQAKDLVDADIMAIHLNFLQEIVQPEGDTNSEGCHDAIKNIAQEFPVIVKETGAGISKDVAMRLMDTGIQGIDIAGMGGTNFSAVELYRAKGMNNISKTNIGKTLFNWGIPSPISLLHSKCCGLPLIASGGILNGIHVAASIAMGATSAGIANSILVEASKSADAVIGKLTAIKEELIAAMMLTGSKSICDITKAKYVVLGETKQWMC